MRSVRQSIKLAVGDTHSLFDNSASAEGGVTPRLRLGLVPRRGDVRSPPHDRPTLCRFKGATHRFATSPLSRQGLRPVEVFIEPRVAVPAFERRRECR